MWFRTQEQYLRIKTKRDEKQTVILKVYKISVNFSE